jgi:hypothetical protein
MAAAHGSPRYLASIHPWVELDKKFGAGRVLHCGQRRQSQSGGAPAPVSSRVGKSASHNSCFPSSTRSFVRKGRQLFQGFFSLRPDSRSMSATVGVLDCAARFAMVWRTRAEASRCSAVQKGVDSWCFKNSQSRASNLRTSSTDHCGTRACGGTVPRVLFLGDHRIPIHSHLL